MVIINQRIRFIIKLTIKWNILIILVTKMVKLGGEKFCYKFGIKVNVFGVVSWRPFIESHVSVPN